MKQALTGGAYQSHSVIASAQRSLNLYSEPMPEAQGEPMPAAHYPTPGTRLLGAIGTGPIRGVRQCTTGGTYVVSGSTVYSVDTSTWTGAALGTITAGLRTPVSMDDNGLDMLVVDGSANGWDVTLASNSMAPISDPSGMFSGADRVDYLDTYFILNKPATPQFYISGSLAVTFDPLDFANKEAYSDLLVTVVVAKRLLYLFGERTTEIWYDAGATDTGAGSFPFAAMQSEVFIDHGCAAKYSPAVYDNSVFWLTRDRQGQGIVMMVSGYQTKRVSTYAIEAEIAGYSRIDDAIGFTYQLAGHSFYVLTFPHQDHTWSYDISTGHWHEWLWIDSNGDEHRHRADAFWPVDGTLVVGDWQNGNLYALDRDVFTDIGVAPGAAAAYRAPAVHFDGATWLDSVSLAATDNQYCAVAMWLRQTSAPGPGQLFTVDATGSYSSNWYAASATGTVAGNFYGATTADNSSYTADAGSAPVDQWVCVIIATATTDQAQAVYINDTLVATTTWSGSPFTMTFNALPFTAFGDTFTGDGYTGDAADVRIMPGVNLLDGSGNIPLATRRLFIDADGKPVDPAVATAALGAPAILFSGDASTFATNQGTGGAFTLTGTLTDATTSPSDGAVLAPVATPIKRVRSFPHILADGKRVFYRQFLADMETGWAPEMATSTVTPPALSGFYSLPRGDGADGAVYGVSADGRTAVGWVSEPGFSSNRLACYWVDRVGPTTIAAVGSTAAAVSGDGSVVAGNSTTGPFYWTASGGVVTFGISNDTLEAISADGSRIVGWSDTLDGVTHIGIAQPCFWDRATLVKTFLPLPSGFNGGVANAVSADGSVIVGDLYLSDGTGRHAFRWTAAGGTVDLGIVSGATESTGLGVADDGTVVGYFVASTGFNETIFSWTPATGFVTPVSTSVMFGANAISGDGSTIYGYGWWPDLDTALGSKMAYMISGEVVTPTPTLSPGSENTAAYNINPGTISRDGRVMGGYGPGGPWLYYVPQPARTAIPVASDSLISLDWSDDRGHHYGSPVTQPIGAAGEYRTSLQWQRCGVARDRVWRLSWSVPMKTALQGAWIDATPAQS